jgi:hypothetical protein
MSELPEKKVLKNALTKLKANAITTNEKYNTQVKSFSEYLKMVANGLQDIPKPSGQDARRIGAVIILLADIEQKVGQLVNGSLEAINDWKTYTEVLENYSAELDNTLTKIFEDAIKQSEERIEKQKELIGKPPEYSR